MKTIAVIPAYNEGQHIVPVLERVQQHVDAIVVVDDGSRDNTFDIVSAYSVQNPKVIALSHAINLGKGAALTTGCEAAELLAADVIVVMDADNQHNPEHIPEFIQAIKGNNVDMVFGSRSFNSEMPIVMKLGNQGLSWLIQKLFRMRVRDTQSGFRAFTPVAFEKMRWQSTGYEVETEMIVRASEQGVRYAEIDIDTIYLDDYKGTTAFDGLKIFAKILQWKVF